MTTVDFTNIHISDDLVRSMLAKVVIKLQLLGSQSEDDEERAQHRTELLEEYNRLKAVMAARSAERVIG